MVTLFSIENQCLQIQQVDASMKPSGHRFFHRFSKDLAGRSLASLLSEANEPGYRLNLSRANLTELDLSHVDFTEVELSRAKLVLTNLTGATMENACLAGANLKDAILKDANLTGAKINNADLRYANLTGAILTDTNLSGTMVAGVQTDDTGFWAHVPTIEGSVAMQYMTAVDSLTPEQLAAAEQEEPDHAFSRAILNVLMPDKEARDTFLKEAGNSMTAICLILVKEKKIDMVPALSFYDKTYQSYDKNSVKQEALDDSALRSIRHAVQSVVTEKAELESTIAAQTAEIARLKAELGAKETALTGQFDAAAAANTVAPAHPQSPPPSSPRRRDAHRRR